MGLSVILIDYFLRDFMRLSPMPSCNTYYLYGVSLRDIFILTHSSHCLLWWKGILTLLFLIFWCDSLSRFSCICKSVTGYWRVGVSPCCQFRLCSMFIQTTSIPRWLLLPAVAPAPRHVDSSSRHSCAAAWHSPLPLTSYVGTSAGLLLKYSLCFAPTLTYGSSLGSHYFACYSNHQVLRVLVCATTLKKCSGLQ